MDSEDPQARVFKGFEVANILKVIGNKKLTVPPQQLGVELSDLFEVTQSYLSAKKIVLTHGDSILILSTLARYEYDNLHDGFTQGLLRNIDALIDSKF